MDDVPVIDHVAMLAIGPSSAAAQGQNLGRPQKAFEAVIVEADTQLVPDQPRGDHVEHLAQREAAMRGDGDKHLLVVGGSPRRQRPQAWPLDREPLGVAPIASANHLVHKPTINRQDCQSRANHAAAARHKGLSGDGRGGSRLPQATINRLGSNPGCGNTSSHLDCRAAPISPTCI
jgi:hypothetical protein